MRAASQVEPKATVAAMRSGPFGRSRPSPDQRLGGRQLGEHIARGLVEDFALFGQDQAAARGGGTAPR